MIDLGTYKVPVDGYFIGALFALALALLGLLVLLIKGKVKYG